MFAEKIALARNARLRYRGELWNEFVKRLTAKTPLPRTALRPRSRRSIAATDAPTGRASLAAVRGSDAALLRPSRRPMAVGCTQLLAEPSITTARARLIIRPTGIL